MKRYVFFACILVASLALKWFQADLAARFGVLGYALILVLFIANAINLRAWMLNCWTPQLVPKGMMAGLLIAAILAGRAITVDIGATSASIIWIVAFGTLLGLSYHLQKVSGDDQSRLYVVLASMVPARMVGTLQAEGRILWTAIFSWKAEKSAQGSNCFTSKNSLGPILFSLAALSIVEWFAIHLAVKKNFPTIALISTFIHVLFILYLIGLAKSLYYKPTIVDKDGILLRFGLMQQDYVPIKEICGVHHTWPLERSRENSFDIVLLSTSNIIIELCNIRNIKGMFGSSKNVRYIGFYFDNPFELSTLLRKQM